MVRGALKVRLRLTERGKGTVRVRVRVRVRLRLRVRVRVRLPHRAHARRGRVRVALLVDGELRGGARAAEAQPDELARDVAHAQRAHLHAARDHVVEGQVALVGRHGAQLGEPRRRGGRAAGWRRREEGLVRVRVRLRLRLRVRLRVRVRIGVRVRANPNPNPNLALTRV